MSATRLFLLLTLAEHGPLHGHRVLRQAQEDRTDLWTEAPTGGVYAGLKRLANEGLIAELRSERDGAYPERVVYGITAAGREALSEVLDATLRTIRRHTDPFDLALAHCEQIDPDVLADIVQTRLATLEAALGEMERKRDDVDPWLSEAEKLAFGHGILRYRTEVEWHREVLDRLPALQPGPSSVGATS